MIAKHDRGLSDGFECVLNHRWIFTVQMFHDSMDWFKGTFYRKTIDFPMEIMGFSH